MRIEVLQCDCCGDIIEKSSICFGHDGTRHFFDVEVSEFKFDENRKEKKLLDLTLLTFCCKNCLIDYLEEKLEDI